MWCGMVSGGAVFCQAFAGVEMDSEPEPDGWFLGQGILKWADFFPPSGDKSGGVVCVRLAAGLDSAS